MPQRYASAWHSSDLVVGRDDSYLSQQEMKSKPNEPLFTWMHLSDIHIGHPVPKHAQALPLILKSLRDDLEHVGKNIGLTEIDAMFVTGDVVWSGKSDQYAEAKTKLLEITQHVGLNAENVFIVPGNHDVDRDVDKKNRSTARIIKTVRNQLETLDEILSDKLSREFLTSRQAAYLDFAQDFAPVCLKGAIDPPEKRLYWKQSITALGGLRVRLVGLNTALVAADENDHGKLYVGTTQWSELLSDVTSDELVILLSHHPFREQWLKDQTDAANEAARRAHVHLSGHVHQADSEELRSGGGSGIVRIVAGAVQGDANAPAEHGYSFGSIYREEKGDGYFVRIYPRRWSDKNRDFRADYHVLEKDSRTLYSDHSIPRFGRKR